MEGGMQGRRGGVMGMRASGFWTFRLLPLFNAPLSTTPSIPETSHHLHTLDISSVAYTVRSVRLFSGTTLVGLRRTLLSSGVRGTADVESARGLSTHDALAPPLLMD
jgi:hypothetical protein